MQRLSVAMKSWNPEHNERGMIEDVNWCVHFGQKLNI